MTIQASPRTIRTRYAYRVVIHSSRPRRLVACYLVGAAKRAYMGDV
jgi:hypothetical protein